MNITGSIPSPRVLAKRITPSERRFATLRKGLWASNLSIISSVTKVKGPALRAKRWELPWAEHQKGWLSKPIPVAMSGANKTIPSPRFRIDEQHGQKLPKFRVIDDLSRSQANSTEDTSDTYCPENLDTLVAQARTVANLGQGNLKARSVDFPNGYKTIGIRGKSKDAATVCFARPDGNKPFKARILSQPFGSRRAPANWGRVATCCQFLASRLLTLVVAAYAGDIFCCEPPATFTSGFRAFEALAKLLGPPTSDRKDHPHTGNIYLLWEAVY